MHGVIFLWRELVPSDSAEVEPGLAATADTLTAVTITGGAAGSTYSLAKLKGTVTGSSGADSFNLDGDDTITLGGGADSVTLDGADNTITDLATNGAKATFVVSGKAVDMTGFGPEFDPACITFPRVSGGCIFMATISLSKIESGSKYLYTNAAKGAYEFSADTVAAGTDSVQVGTVAYANNAATLTLTSSDSVEVESGLASTEATLTAVTITGGAAGSTYSLAKLKGTVTGSSGADSFNLDGDDTITLGGGADSVTLAADAANVTITDLATNGAKATFVVGSTAVDMTGFGAPSAAPLFLWQQFH